MPRFVIIAVLFGFYLQAPVRAEEWKKSVEANLMLTESTYSDSWKGDESGSLTWTFLSNSLAEKRLHPKVNFKNSLKLLFGQNHFQDKESKDWRSPVKSNDLIDLESVLRFSLGGVVDPYAAGRFQSQFLDKSDPDRRRYVNPFTLTESFGAARVLIKDEKRELTFRFGGGLREHVDRDKLDAESGSRSTDKTLDGGLELVGDLKTPLADERIDLTGKLTVFKALIYSKSDELAGTPQADYWRAPDVNLETIWTSAVTTHLAVTLYVQFLYDKEVNLKGRVKQSLSFGLTYKLI